MSNYESASKTVLKSFAIPGTETDINDNTVISEIPSKISHKNYNAEALFKSNN
jgi:hypothetical protein